MRNTAGFYARHRGFEPLTFGSGEGCAVEQKAYLRRFDADKVGDNVVCDSACFMVRQDESSRNVAGETEKMMTRSPMPTSSDGNRPTHHA